MNILRSKFKVSTVALVLGLTIAALAAGLPAVVAQRTVDIYLTFSIDRYPNHVIGVGQPLQCSIATTPSITPYGTIWPDAYANFTKPDGTTDIVQGPFEVPGQFSLILIFEYVPDMAGEWTCEFNYPGDEDYAPASDKRSFTVRQEPVNLFIETTGFISASPKIAGLGQYVLINGWIVPQPVLTGDLHYGVYVEFTDPHGNIETLGPYTTWESGTIYFAYMPDELGTWKAKLTWDGDGTYYTACESPPFNFTVQEEAVELWPAAELPTDYWDRPITAENREWYKISGGWPNTGRLEYDTRGSCFNPYSTAPDTAHMLWIYDVGFGGLAGGEAGSMRMTPRNSRVIVAGKAYFSDSWGLHCLDLHSGEELWVQPGIGGTLYAQYGTTPYIWVLSSGFEFRRYDATTGQLRTTVDVDVPISSQREKHARSGIDENRYIYFQTYDINCRSIRIMKWDCNVNSRNWTEHLVWSVEKEEYWYCDGGMSVYGGYVWLNPNGANTTACIDAETGEVLWDITRPYWMQGAGTISDGLGFGPSSQTMSVHAYNLETGAEVWETEPTEYPWGFAWGYQMGTAYGNIYVNNYDGHIYCYDVETGNTVWKYYSGDTFETPYSTWAFYNTPAIADGKVYAGTTEHSPTDPYPRGNRLYALNAFDGTLLWSIAGAYGQKAIADGVLTAFDEYTGLLLAFSKGRTATTVSASPSVISNGAMVLIEGTITDQSPAQPGTPCVSPESMSAWMEYLHMQRPCPEDITGVPVVLNAFASDGSMIEIGTVTSDAFGHFACEWTPPDEGLYTIMATFNGDGSYYTSYDVTGLAVGPEPAEPEPTEEPAYTTIDLAIIAAVVVAIVIGIVNLYALRKRK